MQPFSCRHQACAFVGRLQNRAFERLLAGSSSSLSSSHSGLAAIGRGISTGAEAAPTPATAAATTASASAQPFPFDFFEQTRCISGDVRLSGDLTQTGKQHNQTLTPLHTACAECFASGPPIAHPVQHYARHVR